MYSLPTSTTLAVFRRVGGLDRCNETVGLDHPQGFELHASGTLTDRGEMAAMR